MMMSNAETAGYLVTLHVIVGIDRQNVFLRMVVNYVGTVAVIDDAIGDVDRHHH